MMRRRVSFEETVACGLPSYFGWPCPGDPMSWSQHMIQHTSTRVSNTDTKDRKYIAAYQQVVPERTTGKGCRCPESRYGVDYCAGNTHLR